MTPLISHKSNKQKLRDAVKAQKKKQKAKK
jgi:hypothetical protein